MDVGIVNGDGPIFPLPQPNASAAETALINSPACPAHNPALASHLSVGAIQTEVPIDPFTLERTLYVVNKAKPKDNQTMPDPHQREVAVFEAALELAREHRASYLEHTCADDVTLRQRVQSLLATHESDEDLLASGQVANMELLAARAPRSDQPGDRLAGYKLLQQIGEGGCGVVYMAEQDTPIRRRVALKIIKLGMDTKQVIARFEAERQALALMDHPNIARVFDAGATETGRPFFVMELVRGVPITEYCDTNRLATQQRLG